MDPVDQQPRFIVGGQKRDLYWVRCTRCPWYQRDLPSSGKAMRAGDIHQCPPDQEDE